ncbi:hypothetical protein GS624_01115 [Ruegeria sp. HKCCD5849]|uniref:hypothetical protein n=1 Tax=unclassified Ruegeria TaxID=2625375 RepID=UPI001490D495|nr:MULTISPECIES: hypothetical protein [unclassified Ruegeria]NOD45904.1 hypothetical protein [Ruegeria sp. HKCCD5849]NOD50796.1 hypothetical protein [Ruegeria sp. HKCCD5851]
MSEARRWKVETSIKLAGLALAAFGIWEYFATLRIEATRNAQSQTLEYIAEANSERHQQALQTLFEFWLRNSDVVELITTTGQTEVGFQAFFVNAIRNDPNGNNVVFAVRQIGRFFDELNICYSTSVCDQVSTLNFFCQDARNYASTYSPIFSLIGGQSGDQDLGNGLILFARECVDAEQNS